jgi:hypothetical protein
VSLFFFFFAAEGTFVKDEGQERFFIFYALFLVFSFVSLISLSIV